MIATPKPQAFRLTPKHQQRFVEMLPTITRIARQSFSDLDPEGKEEAAAEVVASALIMFSQLAERGRESLAYPSVLGTFGVKRVRTGRKAATPANVRDISSLYCRLAKNAQLERLDRFDKYEGTWIEAVVQDHHTPVIDQVWFRIDFPAWLGTHSDRDRQIAEALAAGSRTGEVAEEHGVSAGRISQMRRQFAESWSAFHGEEEEEVEEAACVPA